MYASARLIKSIYGADSLARLDEDEEDDEEKEEEEEEGCLVQIKPVELIELDELIVGALDSASFEFAQQGKGTIIIIGG